MPYSQSVNGRSHDFKVSPDELPEPPSTLSRKVTIISAILFVVALVSVQFAFFALFIAMFWIYK